MKALLLGIAIFASYLTAMASSVWTLVEFIIYLAKDHEFNWWSLWVFIGSSITSIVLVVVGAFYKKKIKSERPSFAERLKEKAKERERL